MNELSEMDAQFLHDFIGENWAAFGHFMGERYGDDAAAAMKALRAKLAAMADTD